MARLTTSARFEELLSLISQDAGERGLSPELLHHLRDLHRNLSRIPVRSVELVSSLRSVLQDLADAGRDCARSCRFVSDFLLAENEWELCWSYVPAEIEDILLDLSQIDDTGAKEQSRELLERLGAIEVK